VSSPHPRDGWLQSTEGETPQNVTTQRFHLVIRTVRCNLSPLRRPRHGVFLGAQAARWAPGSSQIPPKRVLSHTPPPGRKIRQFPDHGPGFTAIGPLLFPRTSKPPRHLSICALLKTTAPTPVRPRDMTTTRPHRPFAPFRPDRDRGSSKRSYPKADIFPYRSPTPPQRETWFFDLELTLFFLCMLCPSPSSPLFKRYPRSEDF